MAYENDNELIISWEAPLEPCPEGRHPIVCVDIFKTDPEEQTYDGVTKLYEKVMLVFQVFPEDGSRDSKGKPFQVERKFTWSLDPQSKLRPTLERWRGRDFTEEELKRFDLLKLKGVSAWGSIVHNTRFVNIQDIEPYLDNNGKALPGLKLEAYIRRNYKKPKKQTASTESATTTPSPSSSGDNKWMPF
jgi:hypothetical protein